MDTRTASPRTAPPTTPPEASDAPGSTPATSEAAAPASTSPLRPTADDVALLGFAQSFELTARDLYQAALDAGLAGGELGNVFLTLRENHEEYANSLSGLLGVDAPRRRDGALFDDLVGDFEGGDAVATAEAGLSLESAAVATYADLAGRLVGLDGLETVGEISTVVARHCTVLAHIAGHGDDLDALLVSDAESLAPSGPSGPSGWRNG